jgi:hypothetical protein
VTEELTQKDVTLTPAPYPAHIVNQPGHEVGDKVLAVCGKKWKVTILWADIPDDHSICHDCVRRLLIAVNEVTDAQGNVLRALMRVLDTTNRALDVAVEETELSSIVEETQAYADKRQAKKDRKQALADARALVAEADRKAMKQEDDKE